MKALKVVVVVVILLIVIVVGSVAAFIAFADPNDFKTQIADKVRESTGRELKLDGDLQWAFWPKIKLKAGPLTLSNAAGFSDEPFLAANEVQIAVATLPLLKSQIEMDTVKLYGARINLATNSEGVSNWADLAGGHEEPKKRSGDIATIALGGVDIQDGSLSWRDAVNGQNVDISELNVSTGALTFGDPIAFELSLKALANQPALDSDVRLVGTIFYDLGEEQYRIEPLKLDVVMRGKNLPNGTTTVTSSAVVEVDLEEGIAKISQLALNGLGTELSGDIEATDIESDAPGARGTIDIKGNDLAQIFNSFELPVAKQIAGLKDRGFNLSTEFDADMQSGNVSVPKLKGTMLGAKLDASLTAERANTDTPAAKGNFSANGPNLPSLLAVIGQLQGLDPKTLNNLVSVLAKTKDKSFNVLTAFDADMQSGDINLPTFEAKLLGNSISGNVASTGSGGKKPALAGKLKAAGPDLPSLLAIAATFQGADSSLHGISKSLSNAPNKAFSLNGNFETDANSGKVALPQLTANGLGLVINGNMKGQNLNSDTGTLDGTLSLKGDKVGPLLRALGQQDLATSVQALNFDAGIKGTMADLTFSPLKMVTKLKGKGQSKAVDVTLKVGTARANLDKETLTVRDLSLTGLGMNVAGKMDATKIKTEPHFDGNLNVPSFNLRKVLANLNKKLPPMASPKALTKFGLSTDFAGTKNSIELKQLKVTLDQSTLKGDLTIADFEGPDVRFELGVDQLNADNYMAPKTKGSAPVTPEVAAAGATQLPVETLRKLKIKGDLLVGKLRFSGAKMQNVKLSVDANGGKIKVNPVAASLYNGSYIGNIKINAQKKIPKLAVATKLAGVNIEPLLLDMTGDRSLSGIANLDANLITTGNNTNALKNNLAGPLKFAVNDGVYRGVDVAAILTQVEVMVESKRPSKVETGGETKFETLNGTINFKNGVGSNKDLLLDGSGFKITGKGVVADLRNYTMKYDAKVSVDSGEAQRGEKIYNLGDYSVPIRCRGALGAKACKPDVGDIVADIGKSAVKKEVGKRLEKALGGDTGKALKKLFKF